jgi:protease-4
MLNPDFLLERSILKKQNTYWRGMFFFAIVVFVLYFISSFGVNSEIIKDASKVSRPIIARITINGVIYEDKERDEIINKIRTNDSIKAVILSINSPGGTAVGGETLFNQIKKLNEVKPVVTVMNSLAASAAYLISVGSERIYAHNGTITGSIGVIAEIPNFRKAADKLGVEFEYVKTSPLKGSPTMFEEKNQEALDVLKIVMNDFYDYFVKIVSVQRKISLEETKKLADGKVFSGKAAVKNKLIDAIGDEEDAVKWLSENKKINKNLKIKDISLEKEKEPLEEFMGSMASIITKTFDFNSISEKYHFKGLSL